jgi:uncharacterized protein (UPF0548 family)
MFRLSRPTDAEIADLLDEAASMSLSYEEIGITAKMPKTTRYNVDHNRIKLGKGPTVFDAAKAAVRGWKMFDFDWIRLVPDSAPIEVGRNVAIVVHHLGFYSLNAARVVFVVSGDDSVDRFGFAYGTLTEHAEIGEERFSVEFDRRTGEVWYDLLAVSRPGHTLAKLGYPISRLLQRVFANESMMAMKRAVGGPGQSAAA